MPKLEIELTVQQLDFVTERAMRTYKLDPQRYLQQTVNVVVANWIADDEAEEDEEKEQKKGFETFLGHPSVSGLLGALSNVVNKEAGVPAAGTPTTGSPFSGSPFSSSPATGSPAAGSPAAAEQQL